MPAILNNQTFFLENPYIGIYSSKYFYDLKNKCIFSSCKRPIIEKYLVLDDNQLGIYKKNHNKIHKTIVRTYESPKMMLDLSDCKIYESYVLYSNCIYLTKKQIEKVLKFNTEILNKPNFIYDNSHSKKHIIYDMKNKTIYISNVSIKLRCFLFLDDNQHVIYEINRNSNDKTIVRTYDYPKMMLDLSNYEIGESCVLHSNCILLTTEQIINFLQFDKIVCNDYDKYLYGHGNIKIHYRKDLHEFMTNDLKEIIYKNVDTIYKIYKRKYTNVYSKVLFLLYACKFFNIKIEKNRFLIL